MGKFSSPYDIANGLKILIEAQMGIVSSSDNIANGLKLLHEAQMGKFSSHDNIAIGPIRGPSRFGLRAGPFSHLQ